MESGIQRLSVICYQIKQLLVITDQRDEHPKIVRKLVKRALRTIQELDRSTNVADVASIKGVVHELWFWLDKWWTTFQGLLEKTTQSMITFINEDEYKPAIIYDDICTIVDMFPFQTSVRSPIKPKVASPVSGKDFIRRKHIYLSTLYVNSYSKPRGQVIT